MIGNEPMHPKKWPLSLALVLIGAFFAWRSFAVGASLLGWAFTLFALAEVSYMTYHLDWTVFLFAHTISEVLDLAAFGLVFLGAVLEVARARRPSLKASQA